MAQSVDCLTKKAKVGGANGGRGVESNLICRLREKERVLTGFVDRACESLQLMDKQNLMKNHYSNNLKKNMKDIAY